MRRPSRPACRTLILNRAATKRDIIIGGRGYLCVACLLLLLLSPISITAGEDQTKRPLDAFQANYSIEVSGITVGKLSRQLQFDDSDRYIYHSESKTVGLAALLKSNKTTEVATGTVVANQIYPQQYDYQREKSGKIKHEQLRFDHQRNVVHTLRRGIEDTLPLQSASLDQLSYQLQLMVDLLREETEFSYRILTAKKSKHYAAIVEKLETISTGAGEFATLRLSERENATKTTTFWCAKSLGYLPVKVEISDGDTTTTIVLEEYRANDA